MYAGAYNVGLVHLVIIMGLLIMRSTTLKAEVINDDGTALTQGPNLPVFKTPEELRTYLLALNDYYALVGRPRFGRSKLKRRGKCGGGIRLTEEISGQRITLGRDGDEIMDD